MQIKVLSFFYAIIAFSNNAKPRKPIIYHENIIMKTNIPSSTLKPACRFKTSFLTAAVVAVLAMTHACLSDSNSHYDG